LTEIQVLYDNIHLIYCVQYVSFLRVFSLFLCDGLVEDNKTDFVF